MTRLQRRVLCVPASPRLTRLVDRAMLAETPSGDVGSGLLRQQQAGSALRMRAHSSAAIVWRAGLALGALPAGAGKRRQRELPPCPGTRARSRGSEPEAEAEQLASRQRPLHALPVARRCTCLRWSAGQLGKALRLGLRPISTLRAKRASGSPQLAQCRDAGEPFQQNLARLRAALQFWRAKRPIGAARGACCFPSL